MKRVVVIGPMLSLSGYGTLARFILKSLSVVDTFDLYVMPTTWGDSSWIYEDSDFRTWMDNLVHKTMNNKQPFDISIQITVPNEWRRLCPLNIGVTAGLETDQVPELWIDKSKEVDKILVTSNHSKDSIINTSINGKTCKTPIEVFELPYEQEFENVSALDLNLNTEFNFLTVAQWAPRKNLESNIRWFIEEFHDDENVGLVVKTHGRNNSKLDRKNIENIFHSIASSYKNKKCSLYLLHGSFSDAGIRSIYKNEKIKALCSTTHGEGYGLPMFEMASEGKPVIATNWSSYLDFLVHDEKEYFIPVEYEMREVQQNHLMPNIILPGFKWAYPKESSFKHCLRKVYSEYETFLSDSETLKKIIVDKYKPEKVYLDLINRMFSGFANIQKVDQSDEEIITYE